MKILFSFVVFFTCASQLLVARPVVEQMGRLSVDWSNMTVRYYGEAQSVASDGDGALTNAEKFARRDGAQYVFSAIKEYHQNKPELKEAGGLDAAERVSKSARSVNTTYFADGQVRVDFENTVAEIIKKADQAFASLDEASKDAKNSSLIIHLSAEMKPTASYTITDEDGKVLFEAKNVTQAAFDKNLMGRWYKKDPGAEGKGFVGESPATLNGTPAGQSNIKISRAEWEKVMEDNEGLLSQAKIAVLIP